MPALFPLFAELAAMLGIGTSAMFALKNIKLENKLRDEGVIPPDTGKFEKSLKQIKQIVIAIIALKVISTLIQIKNTKR